MVSRINQNTESADRGSKSGWDLRWNLKKIHIEEQKARHVNATVLVLDIPFFSVKSHK